MGQMYDVTSQMISDAADDRTQSRVEREHIQVSVRRSIHDGV